MAKKKAQQSIGSRIKAALDAQDLTVYRLAQRSGLSTGHLYALIDDEYKPGIDTLVKLAPALGVSIGDLIG